MSTTTDDADTSVDQPYVWTDDRGRSYAGGESGEIAPLHKLTAVAEHGFDEVANADCIHHALGGTVGDTHIRVNVPEWLHPSDHGEHRKIHNDSEFDEHDGVPLLASDD